VLGTLCHPLNAPLFVARDAMRDALWAEPALRELRRQAQGADLALVSVGDMSDAATLFAAGLVPPGARAELQARGAVGDLLGHFVDADGRPVDHPLNRRVMAIAAGELATVSRVVLASGGARKAAVLRAALRALPVTTLVTDEAAATLLARG
jgi:DNA-binding transcriptional regulator LsrR (DeoR family)